LRKFHQVSGGMIHPNSETCGFHIKCFFYLESIVVKQRLAQLPAECE
jgi:hypothetical protein